MKTVRIVDQHVQPSRREPHGGERMCRTVLGQGDSCFLVHGHYGAHAGTYNAPWTNPDYLYVKVTAKVVEEP